MRARGRRATAIRFQQFGGSYGNRSLSGTAIEHARMRPAGARPAPAACAALCVAWICCRQPTIDGVCCADRMAAILCAAPAMMIPMRRGATNTHLTAVISDFRFGALAAPLSGTGSASPARAAWAAQRLLAARW